MAEVWKEVAKMEQKLFLELFGSVDWDVYRPEEWKLLEDKVGMVIFGPPEGEKYNLWQVDHIEMVTNTIVQKGLRLGTTWTAIVMVVVQPPDSEYYCHPVFRVPQDGHHAFVDCLGRFYQTWKEYLEDNKLPEKSHICYPLDGVYSRQLSGEVRLKFAHTKSQTLLKVADGASNVLAVGSILGVAGAAALSAPLAAPVMLGAAVVSAACGVYDSARAIGDQVDRARHGQRIGLLSGQSLNNWLTMGMGVVGIRSAYKIVQSTQVLTKGAKLGVASRSLRSLRTLGDGIPQEMYRDARCKQMPLRYLPRYALMLGHVVADAGYIAHFLQSSGAAEGGIKALRSVWVKVSDWGERLRYIEFLGFEGGRLQEVERCGVSGLSLEFQLFPAVNVEAFEGVSALLRRTLEGGRHLFANFSINWKAAVDYFFKYDISLYLELGGKVAMKYGWDKARAVLGVLSMLYRCLREVVKMARTGRTSLVKFTEGEILGVARICMERGVDFYDMFGRLCSEYVIPKLGEVAMVGAACYLRKRITSGNSAGSSSEGAAPKPGNSLAFPSKGTAPKPGNSLATPSEEAVLRAASGCVGVALGGSGAKVVYAGSEIFVIITEPGAKLVQVERDEKGGALVASLLYSG